MVNSDRTPGKRDGLSGPLGEMDREARVRYARRLALRAVALAPFVVASVLTTKSVAATKIVVVSVPISI